MREPTDVARKHEKVIVGKSAILLRVQEIIDVKTVPALVVLLQNIESLLVVEYGSFAKCLTGHATIRRVSVDDRHIEGGARLVLWERVFQVQQRQIKDSVLGSKQPLPGERKERR